MPQRNKQNLSSRIISSSTNSTSADDTFWSSQFGYAGLIGIVDAIAVSPNGDVYVGGSLSTAGNLIVNNIAKWDGTSWSALGTGTNGDVVSLACSPNGDLYVGGAFTSAGGIAVNNIAKWDGSTWSALGNGIYGGNNPGVLSLTVDSSGNLFAGGLFVRAGETDASNIARWDGTNWYALGDGTDAIVFSLATAEDGKIYAGGGFDSAGGINALSIAMWDGTSWSDVGGGWSGDVFALASDIYGNIYAGGDISAGVAKWNGVNWSGLGSFNYGYVFALSVSKDSSAVVYAGGEGPGLPETIYLTKWDGVNWSPLGDWKSGTVFAITAPQTKDSRLYAGGQSIDHVAGRYSFMLWQAAHWSPILNTGIYNGLDDRVVSLAFNAKGELFVGGWFDAAGDLITNNITKWDGIRWSDLGGGTNGWVTAIGIDSENKVYAGGFFDSAGGVSVGPLARWDGVAWTSLIGTWTSGSLNFVSGIGINGNSVYISGSFSISTGGVSLNNIGRWDGTSWSALGTGTDGDIYALAVAPNGDLYVGGKFAHAGGTSTNNIAKWDGTSWSALGTGTDGDIYTLAAAPNGNLYVGGSFENAGGSIANHVARWDGTQWVPLGDGTNDNVTAMSIDLTGRLFVGGLFTVAGNTSLNHIASWDGVNWSTLGSGVDNIIWAMASNPVASSDLYIGGTITLAGGKPSAYIAHWNKNVLSVADNWNLVAVPFRVTDYRKSIIYPEVTSDAFAYDGSYVIADTLKNGVGYWLRFNASSEILMTGMPIASDTIVVSGGWNLIGSISAPILTTNVRSDTSGMISSRFFGYTNGYFPTDSILPGHGYWVKVNKTGNLILSSVECSSNTNRVKIEDNSELPPAPPSGNHTEPQAPVTFALEQNYPDPFNPSTIIRYQLPCYSHVRLTIYDVLGAQVTRLIDKIESPGYKSIRWDASDIASGVYLYRLDAVPISDLGGHYTQLKKMVVIR